MRPERWSGVASEPPTSGNGLEVDNTTQLAVIIEEVSEAGKKIGLRNERIEARTYQSLRKAGITPQSKGFEVSGRNGAVYLNVTVISSDHFTISLSFSRPVFYRKGDKWFTNIGTTWTKGGTGFARGDADYMLDGIRRIPRGVLQNEFLKSQREIADHVSLVLISILTHHELFRHREKVTAGILGARIGSIVHGHRTPQ